MNLDVILTYDREIVWDVLDEFQRLLVALAPRWSQKARCWRYREPDVPIDMDRPGALKEVTVTVGTERGPLYRSLTSMADAERFGSVEVRGANSALVVVVRFDVRPYRHAGPAIYRNNRIALQVRATKVDGMDAATWAERAFVELVGRTAPVFGSAGLVDEFWASNMLVDAQGTRAVGVDVSRSVSGLYWLTYFGLPYVSLLGDHALLSAPAPRVEQLGSGILIGLADRPGKWTDPTYQQTSATVKRHLGDRFFWDKADPARETVGLSFAE